jgi:transposase
LLNSSCLRFSRVESNELEPVRRFEVFAGTGRRRDWSAAEKAQIVAESYETCGSVSEVARRHALSPQQLFAWRRAARQPDAVTASPPLFVPAMMAAADMAPEVPARHERRHRSVAHRFRGATKNAPLLSTAIAEGDGPPPTAGRHTFPKSSGLTTAAPLLPRERLNRPREGPRVRIRLPPAASHERTRLPRRDRSSARCLGLSAQSTFPQSRKILAEVLDDEQAKIAGGNTTRVCNFDVARLRGCDGRAAWAGSDRRRRAR